MKHDKEISSAIHESQKEMRGAFLGGFAGQLVSGIIWLISSCVSVLSEPMHGMATLFVGCMAIFPLTQLILKLMGRPAKVGKDNGLWPLGSQIAFMVPINFLLVFAISMYRPIWFYPASMIIVGTHYLPFMTLYGMKMFGILAAILILLGTYLGVYGPLIFSLGGWFTGVILILFAFIGKVKVIREEA